VIRLRQLHRCQHRRRRRSALSRRPRRLLRHDHDYERFAPQTADGQLDLARGIRSFVVGTGGKNLEAFKQIQPNSEVRDSSSYDVLKLTLRSNSYDWEFMPAGGGVFRDAGSGTCR
jgi:hypothetical protein